MQTEFIGLVDTVALEKLLRLREGYRTVVYKDTEGYPTCGIGHLLTAAERERYPVGSKVTAQQVQTWFDKDSAKFIALTNKQLAGLGITKGYRHFAISLCSANYQLGNFQTVFYKTYERLQQGKYTEAVAAIKASKWHRQTPTRTADFIAAIQTLDPSTMQVGIKHFDKAIGALC